MYHCLSSTFGTFSLFIPDAFVSKSNIQHSLVIVMLADDHQSNRKALHLSTRNAQSWMASKVGMWGDRAHIEPHLDLICKGNCYIRSKHYEMNNFLASECLPQR